MTKSLYDIFAHWWRGGNVYFYSDPHFGDDEINSSRGITDDEQVININKEIGKNDTIVILGDIGDPTFLKKIRGYKIIVLGNHDKGSTVYKEYADEVYEGILMISDKIMLSHEPVDFKYVFNIHGHDHANRFRSTYKHMNVCAELINYTPIALTSIIKAGLLADIPNIHRTTIDKTIERKRKKK